MAVSVVAKNVLFCFENEYILSNFISSKETHLRKTQDFGLLYSKLQNSLHKTFIQNTHSRRQCQEGTSNKSHGGDMVVQKMCIYSFIAD